LTVAVGAPAPDFELLDQHGTPVRLASFRAAPGVAGRNVVLVFYPWSFSSLCTDELKALQDDVGSFVTGDTVLLAVSVDSKFTQRAFADQRGLSFPVLADFWPHGDVARRYGVFDDDAGAALRGTFVIDREGVVRWSVLRGIGEVRDPAAYKAALDEVRVTSARTGRTGRGAG
jgi:mycoredoxin-dependent peroxiredoxin